MEEIRGELRGREMDLKAEGVVKMCYVSRVCRKSEAENAASGKRSERCVATESWAHGRMFESWNGLRIARRFANTRRLYPRIQRSLDGKEQGHITSDL